MKIGNMEVFGVIYKITNKVNNKSYIGQTIHRSGFKGRYSAKGNGIERVYNYYRRCLKYNSKINEHLFSSIEKYGFENFEVNEIKDIAFTQDELNIKEKCWISFYNSNKTGYNIQEGGNDYKTLHNYIKKYSNQQIIDTKQLIIKNIYTDKEISNATGVNVKTIYTIRIGNGWEDIGFDFNGRIKEIQIGKHLSKNFTIETYKNEIENLYSNGNNYLEIYDYLNNKYFKSNKCKPIKSIYHKIRSFCVLLKRKSEGRVRICECCKEDFVITINRNRKKQPKYCNKCRIERNKTKAMERRLKYKIIN